MDKISKAELHILHANPCDDRQESAANLVEMTHDVHDVGAAVGVCQAQFFAKLPSKFF